MDEVFIPLAAGAFSGFCVDIALFPIDTLKTRMQSSQGFLKAGGFKGIYAGISATFVGSAPGAAVFFMTYESVKSILHNTNSISLSNSLSHMSAAAVGEIMACLIRVPCEVVKQRRQTQSHQTTANVLNSILKNEGVRGLYRGYVSTLSREIPFSVIQFPLWEYIKAKMAQRNEQGETVPLTMLQSLSAGFLAGGIAAGITTPLDVAKTRIMLAPHDSPLSSGRVTVALKSILQENGFAGLFAGVLPRMTLISVGGAIFLGAYDKTQTVLSQHFVK